jgi:outer membrane receptor protein involved in Fe transport
MKTRPRTFHLASLAFASLALPLTAFLDAQQAPVSTPPPDDNFVPANEEVTVLPEFSVSATRTNEYVAAESVTGTRVAVKLRDLPFTVNVITADFLDDFNALEFREQTAYTSNIQGHETVSTGYSVRGIDASVQLRNGFRRIGLIDKVNVERVEVIKGAAASIYGTVMPGGTVNIITKKPKTKPEQRIGFTVGGNSLYRGQASTTGPLVPGKLFYRVDAAAMMTDYDVSFKHVRQYTIASNLMWKIAPQTSLLLEYEYLNRREQGMGAALIVRKVVEDPYFPVRADGSTPGNTAVRTYNRYDHLSSEFPWFSAQGPWSYANRDIHTLTLTFEHRFNRVFSVRSGANWFTRSLERQEVGSREITTPATAGAGYTAGKGTARIRPYPEGGAAWQTDFLASWNTGSVKHKTLLTFDYQLQTEKPERWDSTTAFASPDPIQVTPYTQQDYDDYNAGKNGRIYNDYYIISYHDRPELYTLSQLEDNSLNLYGVFLSERATLFDDRINVLGGVRYDNVKSHAIDKVAGTDLRTSPDAVSYQFGGNIRLLPAVTAYANVSKSFVPKFSKGRDEDGNTIDLPNEIGNTWEIGFKAGFFDDRLTFTAAHFDVMRENVTRTAYNSEGISYDAITGKETSKGYELDFNWALTQELQIFGGYGYTDSRNIDSKDGPAFVSLPTRRTPLNSGGFGAKYTVRRGVLKGLYGTIGCKFASRSLVNAPGRRTINSSGGDIVNLRMPNGQLIYPNLPENTVIPKNTYVMGTTTTLRINVDDGREQVWNQSHTLWDLGIGYRFKVARRYNHKFQLNISNALDKIYTYGAGGQGPRRSWAFSYDLSY